MKCWIYSCWRDAVGESRFCAVHGWNQTGKDHVPLSAAPARDPRKTTSEPWSRETIVAAIQRWIADRGRAPTQDDWALAAEGRPTLRTVRIHFGTWSAALSAAGVERRPGRPRAEASA